LQILQGTSTDWHHVRGREAQQLSKELLAAISKAELSVPEQPEAMTLRMRLQPAYPDWTRLENDLLAACRRWPGEQSVTFLYGCFLLHVGRQGAAMTPIGRAYRLDPLHAASANAYAGALRACGDIEGACEVWSDLVHRFPMAPQLLFNLALSLAKAGRWEEVDAWLTPSRLSRFPQRSERMRYALLAIEARRSSGKSARTELEQMAERGVAEDGELPLALVATLSEFCDLDWLYGIVSQLQLERLRRRGARLSAGEATPDYLFLPDFHRLRSDPRFAVLCARLGFSEYWVGTGNWPDCAEEPGLTYDFRQECRQQRVAPPAV
jgi:Flp pilus assembly protein TadD